MYLSELDIFGFKSFAQKIKFRFPDGMTALVGPNGCGKTNIVDAIRWVLGEQKTSVLRSDVMENVIFNGSRNRKPLGLAEVSLTLENNKNILPIEYNQVTITRRLLRSGESKYLLNKTKCRLRDINDLFMDTGMGPDSYSVIELKMVEAILSGRVDERRSLFEEAAGITKYKLRRKETARKLAAVKKDLERVQDILFEVQKNVNSLSRQAAKTRKYNKLIEQVKVCDVGLLQHEYHHLKIQEQNLLDELRNLNDDKEIRQSGLNEMTKDFERVRQRFHATESDYNKARDDEIKVNSKLTANKQVIAVSNEKLAALANLQERLANEINSSNDDQNRVNIVIESNQKKLDAIANQVKESEQNLEKVNISRSKARSEVQRISDAAKELNRQILILESNIASMKSARRRNIEREELLSRKIARSKDEIAALNLQSEEQEKELQALAETNISRNRKVEEARSKLRAAQEHKRILQNNLNELTTELNDKRNALGSKKASLDFLSSLVDTTDVPKFLLSSKAWRPKSDKALLAESVGADEEYRVAVTASLGDAAHFFVVDSRSEAFDAFGELRKSKKGKASFICRREVPEISAPADLPQIDGVYGWLSELVRVDDKLRFILRGLLRKTAVVNSLEAALDLVKAGKADAAVTLDGESVDRMGIIRGGAVLQKEGMTVGRKERSTKLKNEIAGLAKQIEQLEISYGKTNDELKSIDVQAIESELQSNESLRNANEQQIALLELKRESVGNNIKLVEKNIMLYGDEIAEFEKEAVDYEDKIKSLGQKLEDLLQEYAEHNSLLIKSEEELKIIDEQYRAIEIRLVRQNSDSVSYKREIQRGNDQISHVESIKEQKKSEIEINDNTIFEIGTRLDALGNEIEELEKQLVEFSNISEFLQQQKASLSEQIEQIERDLGLERSSFDKSKEAIYQKELQKASIASRMNNISIRARDSYDIEIEELDFAADEEFSIEESRAELQELRDKLMKIGNVNFMALEEYEKENERFEFLNKQVTDLVEAEKTLNETIEEINQTAEKNFLETFDTICTNFKNLFRTLFGGEGLADLKLAGDNPLESDIMITARPPGKRPHSIEMLSGGEKTLTAIALLFAIYLVKPSPFCILDEVDAPLDDENIDRFINLIKQFSERTQFLIVTHNKKTMAAADSLYGITMQESGVSKVVSVRLNSNGEGQE